MKTETGPPAARRLWWALLLACAVSVAALGGCSGDGGDHEKPADPLRGALSYLRADSGAVFVVATDPEGGPLAELEELGSSVKGWRSLKRRLESSIGLTGIDFDLLRRQLGHPLALAATSNGARVGAIRMRDPVALRRGAQDRIDGGKAERLDDHRGALLWKEKGAGREALAYFAAVDSDLVVAQSEQDLESAIDAAEGSENVTSQGALTSALARLDPGALVRVVGDAQRLLSANDPGQAADARKIPWVRALGLFSGTSKVARRGVSVDLYLRTDRVRLSDDQLPLPSGRAAPLLHDRRAPAALAVLEPERLSRFLERTLAITDPGTSARYRAGVAQLHSLFGVDLHRDLLGKITNLSVAAASARAITFEGRLERGAGPTFARALDKAQPFVGGVVADLVPPGSTIEARGAGEQRVWFLKNRGLVLARYAVRRGTLVGSIGPRDLPVPVRGRRLAGVEGALVVKGDPGPIAPLAKLLPGIPRELTAIVPRLGNVTTGIRAQPRGLTVRARLEVGR